MLIRYSLVSTDNQHLDLQRDALTQVGCEHIYEYTVSGALAEREGLAKLINSLRPGDSVVIWCLDRLGRSLKNLLQLVDRLDGLRVGLRSLQESIDTTSGGGRLVFHLFGALAEFERSLVRERAQAGLSAARRRGVPGRQTRTAQSGKKGACLKLHQERNHTIEKICNMMGISKSTLYNYLSKAGKDATGMA